MSVRVSTVGCLILGLAPLPVFAQELEKAIQHAQSIAPRKAADLAEANRVKAVVQACREVDNQAAAVGTAPRNADASNLLERVDRLLTAKHQTDRLLDESFALRKELVKGAAAPDRAALRNYQRVVSAWIDLSGRMRYQLQETINDIAFRVAAKPDQREKLLDLLVKHRSSMGAESMAWLLFDPPAKSFNGAVAASPAVKRRVLQLLYATGNSERVPLLARFIREEKRFPELTVAAAVVLRQVGFPQDQRPGDTDERARPPITAAELLTILQRLPADSLSAPSSKLRDDLVKWLSAYQKQGLVGDTYRLGNFELKPGDWMLMRNPSPYNRFTDLSPGLFTHVGVLTVEKGKDGRRRMVVVDLPERGTHIRASNADEFIRETRHCLFLRHSDPAIAKAMGEAAANIIGNECVFDLNFRIDTVVALKGKPIRGQVIKTYCAGLLLVCGQEAGLERTRIFPVSEKVAGGKTEANLKSLGISFAPNFVSPTGPLFAKEFEVIGHRMPMYAPATEIADAVYDHFAACMARYDLSDTRNSYQEARLRLAEAAKDNPALARLLGQLNNVNPAMDLVAAAKTAAVVENLDRTANTNSQVYGDALFALTCGPLERLAKEDYKKEEIEQFRRLRERHTDLFRRLVAGQLDPRSLRLALVAYYVERGQKEIEKRFKVSTASQKK